ncbi:SUKH-4 family immunity protein [Streptomyces sp. RKAG290]|uniref:SUKH-4 family immunity protein n=1 Tax=Streptomyces sp. RKAG290 TaxID=2888348 RepID=UPI0020332EF1|nr:SUKH-4 family immunity protein [Streptomyces sp. RKAG290]MCM2413998.1 SUKH-4 family immunity protein [Streptomyces sp. RKAG290]
MSCPVTRESLFSTYGANGVRFFPEYSLNHLNSTTSTFLSSVGLPNDHVFDSGITLQALERSPYELGPLFELDNRHCPVESQDWQVLGHLPAALVTIDPISGKVYVFQESSDEYQLMHRDIASLVYCLTEFRKLDDAYKAAYPESPNVENLVESFRQEVDSIDPTPLSDPESEWNRMLGEVLEEMW